MPTAVEYAVKHWHVQNGCGSGPPALNVVHTQNGAGGGPPVAYTALPGQPDVPPAAASGDLLFTTLLLIVAALTTSRRRRAHRET